MANNNGFFKTLLGLIASAALTVIIALTAWTLKEVVALKVDIARLDQKLEDHMTPQVSASINGVTR